MSDFEEDLDFSYRGKELEMPPFDLFVAASILILQLFVFGAWISAIVI